MTVSVYQAMHQEFPTNLLAQELVLESELPERLQELNNKTQNINEDGTIMNNITSINGNKLNYDSMQSPCIPIIESTGQMTISTRIHFQGFIGDPGDPFNPTRHAYLDYKMPDTLEFVGETTGIIKAANITTLETKTQYITASNNNTTITGTLNGNKIGAPDTFAYTAETPYIPVCKANGTTEIGNRLDFHLNDSTSRDFSTCLTNTGSNQLSIQNTNGTTFGNLELSTITLRPSETTSCKLYANTASNLLWFNYAGVNTWVCDATSSLERWSTTRDNALNAITRTTGMTYTAATTEPVNPANTTFAGNITSSECYAGRYHTNSTSSLPINSVSSVSTWGAIRIQRTGLAQNTPCGFMFGRGNDTNMPKNLCAIYYVCPTTDITKGEIRIGVETEASTSSTNCITFDTDTKETKFPANITAPNITGITYNNNLLLQSTDYTTATVISNHLHINLTGMTYKPYLGIRALKDNLADGQEVMFQLGKSHTRAISFVYKHTDTIDNSQYRIDFAGRTAYTCKYGATKTEHEKMVI